MLICKICNNYIPDIGDHFCVSTSSQPLPSFPNVDRRGQKCDICGSTAIDHTEAQCQLNRVLKKNSGV